MIGGEDEAAGAAGVVGDAVILEGFGVGPIEVVRDGEMGGQDGAFGASVVGGKGLAVGNEPLEYGASNVVYLDGFLNGVGGLGCFFQ